MPKNIVIFSDGTGQEGGRGTNTNVYRLFNIILDRSPEQVAFYDRGLGTGRRKLTGNVGGGGISKNIQECYRFIFDNYQAGDQIYLFGFSRGAATVRSLSGFIHMFGILPKSRPELIKKAYKIYKTGKPEKRLKKAKSFVARHHTLWTKVRYLGVWDTVAALGLPVKWLDVIVDKLPFWKHEFHDFKLSESVEHAIQALAIDDRRKTFHPVLWEPHLLPYQTMEQVWFCGMHTDVGGGYEEPQLSDIALEWMVQKAVRVGLLIYDKQPNKCAPNPNGVMHDSCAKGIGKLYRKKPRFWKSKKYGKPTVHESVTLRTRNEQNKDDSPYEPWILKGEFNVEAWVHPEDWGYMPEGLKDWCTPVDTRSEQRVHSGNLGL